MWCNNYTNHSLFSNNIDEECYSGPSQSNSNLKSNLTSQKSFDIPITDTFITDTKEEWNDELKRI